MSYQTITLDVADKIATITLNKPERLNACSLDMADEIFDALDNLGDARCVLITGAGRAFCSGADLQAAAGSSITGGRRSYLALMHHYNPLMLKLARLGMPVITAVNGPAAGVGCSIALAGDFALAGKSAYFLQAFVNIGLVPDGGASWMLARLIGKARATQMMMLGEKIGAEQAENWGLIYKCVEDAELMAEAKALATRLANGPTVAIGILRQNLAKALESDLASALVNEAEGQLTAGDSEDAVIGASAFLAKQKAQFVGR
ncbi:MAG: enoyl-CoA hydratase-related protein [Blastomonas sp.]